MTSSSEIIPAPKHPDDTGWLQRAYVYAIAPNRNDGTAL